MLKDILLPQLTRAKLSCRSQKKALEGIAQTVQDTIPSITALPLFKQLVAREQLGSTALGDGVAIPHCRSGAIKAITGCLISLNQGIDFEAPDDQPVDLLFALLVPEDEADAHLNILAELAEIFANGQALLQLRSAQTDSELFDLISGFANNTVVAS